MRKLALILSLIMCIGLEAVFAQTKTITGLITSSEDGGPIPGASIVVKGTTIGTVSRGDGTYELPVPADATTLTISFVGMRSQEIQIQGRTKIDVQLVSESIGVDEVIVTALGISRSKKALGYAVQDVKSEELMKAASPNVISSLSGKVAGVQISQAGGQIGASSRVVIRGNSSLGNNEPLVVIDGVPVSSGSTRQNNVDYGSGLNDVNPQDIESVSVLKGGAAAALYGMRAGHGVILITTKSGKKGQKGITVEYDGNYNVDRVYSIQKMQNKYGQGYLGSEWDYRMAQEDGYTGTYQEFALGGYDAGYGFKYVDGMGNGVNDGVDESWGPRLDIGLNIPQFNSPLDASGNRVATPWVSNPDNLKDLFRTGVTTNHNVALTSVTESSMTRLSLGIREQQGTLPNTDLSRYSASVNSKMKISEKFDYDFALNYTRTESDNLPITEYNASNPMQSMGQWFGRQVDMKDLKANWKKTMDNGYPYNWNSNYHNNPYWSLNKNTNSFDKNRVFGKTSLFFKPLDVLKFEARLGLDYYDTRTNPITAYRSNEMQLDYAQWDGGWFRLNKEAMTEVNSDFYAYFDKQFGDWSVNLVAGANYRNVRYEYSSVGADKLTVPDLFTISNVMGNPVTAMDRFWRRSNSVLGSGSFGFKNMAFLDASIRKDWDSTIKDPITYPAFSVSWLPLETFGVESSIVNFVKLRGGWAEVGSATDPYLIDPYFAASAATINGVTQFSQSTLFPPAGLVPEQVVTTEFGAEVNLLNNRIGMDLAIYNKMTTNQILQATVSKATGYNAMLLNAGEIESNGIELMLRGSILKNSNGLNWDMTLNWSKETSMINELYTDPNTGEKLASYNIGAQWSTYVQAIPGKEWGVITGRGMVRNDNGDIIVNASGLPRTAANMDLGNVNPDWMAGLRNEFTYKNLSMGFLLDFRKGGDIFSISQMFGAYSGVLEFTATGNVREDGLILGRDFLKDEKFVKETAPGVYAPNDIVVAGQDFFESYYSNRELSVFDGSYLKLREMHLTYQMPKGLFGSDNFIKGGSISLVGSNLAILWRHKSNITGMDPETTVSSANSGVGLETTSYPPARSMGLKVSFKF